MDSSVFKPQAKLMHMLEGSDRPTIDCALAPRKDQHLQAACNVELSLCNSEQALM